MNILESLLDMERRFWTSGTDFYRRHLAADVMMVFPELVGVLDRPGVLRSLDGTPRWQEVHFDDPRWVPLGASAVVVTYVATASRDEGAERYRARVTSGYVRSREAWLLGSHHQVPCP